MNQVTEGKLVTIEGIDGAGKTSVGGALASKLREVGVDAVFVSRLSEPSNTVAATRLRALSHLLWEYPPDVDVRALGDRHLILLMASWFALFDAAVVRSALPQHRVVITDQSPNKYIARFHAKGICDVAALFQNLRRSDLALHLVVDPPVAVSRKGPLRETECGAAKTATLASFICFQQSVQHELVELRDAAWRAIDAKRDMTAVVADALDATRELWSVTPLDPPLGAGTPDLLVAD